MCVRVPVFDLLLRLDKVLVLRPRADAPGEGYRSSQHLRRATSRTFPAQLLYSRHHGLEVGAIKPRVLPPSLSTFQERCTGCFAQASLSPNSGAAASSGICTAPL